MLPLAYQFKSCWTHSHGAIEGSRAGAFSPDMSPPPESFDAARALITEGRETLEGVDEDELERMAGNDLVFSIGDKFSARLHRAGLFAQLRQPEHLFPFRDRLTTSCG